MFGVVVATTVAIATIFVWEIVWLLNLCYVIRIRVCIGNLVYICLKFLQWVINYDLFIMVLYFDPNIDVTHENKRGLL
jgi:hypothetical protein